MSDDFAISGMGVRLQSRTQEKLQTLGKQLSGSQTIEKTTNLSGKQGNLQKIKSQQTEKAATDFEALLLHEMIKSMWATVPQNGFLSGGNEEAMYQDMFQEAVSNEIASGRGIGIKEVLIKEFEKQNK